MVAPYAGIDGGAFAVWRAGLADFRVSEHSLAAIQPAVGPQGESIQCFVGVLVRPSIEHDLGRTRRLWIVSVFDGNEHEIWGRTDPDTAETYFQTADQIETFHENCASIKFAIAICVFKDEDAIFPLPFRCANGISVGFCDPDAATVINRKRDGLFHIWLAGEEGGFEAR